MSRLASPIPWGRCDPAPWTAADPSCKGTNTAPTKTQCPNSPKLDHIRRWDFLLTTTNFRLHFSDGFLMSNLQDFVPTETLGRSPDRTLPAIVIRFRADLMLVDLETDDVSLAPE